jgi:hypothetical protein
LKHAKHVPWVASLARVHETAEVPKELLLAEAMTVLDGPEANIAHRVLTRFSHVFMSAKVDTTGLRSPLPEYPLSLEYLEWVMPDSAPEHLVGLTPSVFAALEDGSDGPEWRKGLRILEGYERSRKEAQ